MNVVAVIQARMGSTRLPGKVMMDLGGHPVLEWVHRACKEAPGVNFVVIATSRLPQDDVIFEWGRGRGYIVHRGSETDVLDRVHDAATWLDADIVLRITGDCPFVDPQVIGSVVYMMKQTKAAYCSNTSPRTYPDGLDVQAARMDVLDKAHDEATRAIDRDCVMTWIERNRSRFPAETIINPIPGMQTERWVLDTAGDYEFCKAIATIWGWGSGPPSQLDILNLLDRTPDIRVLNANQIMNERFFDALAEEDIYARTFGRSQAQLKKAQEFIPLGAQTFSKSHLQFPQPSPLFVTHGDGGLVWDVDGNEYVDLVSALLPNVLGYRDADVDVAIRRQVAAGISFSLATELEAELAETLCRLIPCAEAVRFGKTGTDATTAAIRLARAYTGRDRVLICGGYHGWADWSVERNLGVPEDVRNLTTRIPFGDYDAADAYFTKMLGRPRSAAVIVEPEGNPGYLQHLRSLCNSSGTVLIFDEVITGFRFNLGGAQKLYGVTPDLATFGKSMANGMPLSAIVGRKDIMKKFEPPENIFYSGTMFGETLSLAAAIATIKKLERDDLVPQLWRTGTDLSMRASEIIDKYDLGDFIRLSGEPSLVRLQFFTDKIAALFRREMIKTGTLIIASHNVCSAHTENDIKRVLKSYDHACNVIAQAIAEDRVEATLAGASVMPTVRS